MTYRGIYFAFCALKGGGKVFKSGHTREEFLVLHHQKFFPGISKDKLFPKNLEWKRMREGLKLFPKQFQKENSSQHTFKG